MSQRYNLGLFQKPRAASRRYKKGHFFSIKKLGTPNLISPHVHSLFATVLIKQNFEKNKSLRAASGSPTQLSQDLKNLGILLENSAEGLGSRREHC